MVEPNDASPRESSGRWMAATLAMVAFGLAGFGAWRLTGVVVDGDRIGRPPTSFFEDHGDDLERVRALIETGEIQAEGYYGPELPHDLQYLSATGKVSIYGDGSFFIPRWTGIPDDAGGIWWSRASPESRDMYGMECVEPADLIGDWWLCD